MTLDSRVVSVSPGRVSDDWKPQWSKSPRDKYRELQNIPEHWGATKVVLIWFGEDRQELRVFVEQGRTTDFVMRGLLGNLMADNQLIAHSGVRREHRITLEQYEKAEE